MSQLSLSRRFAWLGARGKRNHSARVVRRSSTRRRSSGDGLSCRPLRRAREGVRPGGPGYWGILGSIKFRILGIGCFGVCFSSYGAFGWVSIAFGSFGVLTFRVFDRSTLETWFAWSLGQAKR